MTTRRLGRVLLGAALALAVLPTAAGANITDAATAGKLPDSVAINSTWCCWRTAGDLHAGGLRAAGDRLLASEERGHGGGQILTNFSIAAIAYWAIGFALAFGNGKLLGHAGFFLRDYGDPQKAFGIMGLSDATIQSKWMFQFSFCAVSLAIVWGTTLERIKFGVYVIYAIVFAAFIYPIASHWVFRRWLAAVEHRHAGLRRFHGGAHDRRHRRPGGAPPARAAPRQVRQGRQASGHSRPQHAAVRPRRADPVARLVRVQPGLDAQRDGRPLPRGRDGHDAGGRRGRAVRDPHGVLEDRRRRHRHGRQRRDRRARGHHRPVGLRRAVGCGADRRGGRRDRAARRVRDRQEARRSGRCAHRTRSVRRVGDAGLRHLHLAAAGLVQRGRQAGHPLHRLVLAAGLPRRWAS